MIHLHHHGTGVWEEKRDAACSLQIPAPEYQAIVLLYSPALVFITLYNQPQVIVLLYSLALVFISLYSLVLLHSPAAQVVIVMYIPAHVIIMSYSPALVVILLYSPAPALVTLTLSPKDEAAVPSLPGHVIEAQQGGIDPQVLPALPDPVGVAGADLRHQGH